VIAAIAIASVAAFMAGFWMFRVAPAARQVLATTTDAAAAMRNPAFDDRQRETAVQQASLRLGRGFVSILLRGALALLAGLLPILIADVGGLASRADVFHFLSRWDVVAITTVVLVAAYVLWGRVWRSS